jgi:hypothetical protein
MARTPVILFHDANCRVPLNGELVSNSDGDDASAESFLPIAVAAAELLGMQPTTEYLDFSDYPVERIAEILKQKLNSSVQFCWNLEFWARPFGDFRAPSVTI